MKKLEPHTTWNVDPRPVNTKVLPGTWAFKVKRFPDGHFHKAKACFCVQGDQQVAGISYFETYAVVVSLVTIHLLLTMSIAMNLSAKQVDYTNAFIQAKLKPDEDMYVEFPHGFEHTNDVKQVLKLNKSLYGLCQSPL